MCRISFVIAVFMTASLTWSIEAGDAPKRSAELQVLDRLIGDWETVVTVKATGEKSTSVQSRRWSRNGKFVISEELEMAAKKESHFLVTYDPKAKMYRACFINEQFTTPLLGTWDDSSQTMRWKSSDIAYKHEGVTRYINKDLVEWTMTISSPEGKVVMELSARQTRRTK